MAKISMTGIIVSISAWVTDVTTKKISSTDALTADRKGIVTSLASEKLVKDVARNKAGEDLKKEARKILEQNAEQVGGRWFTDDARLATIDAALAALNIRIDLHNASGNNHFVRGDGPYGCVESNAAELKPDGRLSEKLARTCFRDVAARLANIRLLIQNGDWKDAGTAISVNRNMGAPMPIVVQSMITTALESAHEALRTGAQQVRDAVREAIRTRTSFTPDQKAIGATLDLSGLTTAEGFCVVASEEEVEALAAAGTDQLQ